MMNFNGICRKNVTYDTIKGHQKSCLHPLSRKFNVGKVIAGVQLIPPVFLGLIKSQGRSRNFTGTGIRHRSLP